MREGRIPLKYLLLFWKIIAKKDAYQAIFSSAVVAVEMVKIKTGVILLSRGI